MAQTQVRAEVRGQGVSQNPVTVIVSTVASYYDVSPAQLMAPVRTPLLVEARHVAMQLLYEQGYGASATGRVLGRDHATVLHGLRRMEERLTRERWDALQSCRREVRGRLAREREAVGA